MTLNKVLAAFLLFVTSYWCNYVMGTVVIPHSFSQNHKSEHAKSLTIEKMNFVLSRYQLDSHIEVVLLGDALVNSAMPIDALLEKMSATSASTSPLTFVHEKLVYHVVYSDVLTRRLDDIVAGASRVSPKVVEQLLIDHHNRGSAATSLYVLLNSLREKTVTIQYDSSHPTCRHGAFLSDTSSFAWVDLTAKHSNVQPVFHTGEIFLPPNISSMITSMDMNQQLASFVHASGEALVPFPFHPLSTMVSFTPEKTKFVHLLLITICIDAGLDCLPNPQATKAANRIKTVYGGSSNRLKVHVSNLEYNIADHPSIAHAVYSSIPRSVRMGLDSEWAISADRLLHWLANSATFRDDIAAQLTGPISEGDLLLPVLTLSVPERVEPTWTQSNHPVLFKIFPEPPNKWNVDRVDHDGAKVVKDEAAAAAAANMRWPATIVLQAIPGNGQNLNIMTHLECDYMPLWGNHVFVEEQLFYTIREASFGILPPSAHYSESSMAMVRDYVWFTPSFLRLQPDLSGSTFRDKRAVHRAVVIHRAEEILKRFSAVLKQLQSIMPAHNITALLGVDEVVSKSSAASAAAMQQKYSASKNKQQATSTTAFGSRDKDSAISSSKGLFEKLLKHMDDAATDFSHLDFEYALMKLNNAENLVITVDREVAKIKANRKGVVSCFAPIIPFTPDGGVDGDGRWTGPVDEPSASVERDSIAIHDKPAWLTWALIACGALLGVGLAIPGRPSSKSKQFD